MGVVLSSDDLHALESRHGHRRGDLISFRYLELFAHVMSVSASSIADRWASTAEAASASSGQEKGMSILVFLNSKQSVRARSKGWCNNYPYTKVTRMGRLA